MSKANQNESILSSPVNGSVESISNGNVLFAIILTLFTIIACGGGQSAGDNVDDSLIVGTVSDSDTTNTTDDTEASDDTDASDDTEASDDTDASDDTVTSDDTGSTGDDDNTNTNIIGSINGRNQGIEDSEEEVGVRDDQSGAFRTHCIESHQNSDDPLVFPNQEGASHPHIFFGNPTVTATTTQVSLQTATGTTCDGGTLNRSAYWVPALFDQNDERIEYVEPLFYYKTGYHVPASNIQPLPAGLNMIAGDPHAKTEQSTSVIKFRCGSWQSDQVWFDQGDPLDHVAYLPYCEVDDILEIRIVFPQCWDGENLYMQDQSHMAYPSRATPPITGTGNCPDSHPVALPEISYNFSIYVSEDTGPPNLWRFSCETVAGGLCAHADWMNGWDTDTMDKIVNNCLRPAKECMVSLLGDGTRLKTVLKD